MATEIKCPGCGQKFAIEDAVSEDIKKELREKMQTFLKQKEEDFAKREKELIQQAQHKDIEFAKKLQEETTRVQQSVETSLRKTISSDFETKLQLLQQANKDQENKLVEARQKEIAFLQKEQALKNKEAELELSVQRKLQEERVKLSEELRKLEEQKTATRENEYQLRLRELEKQLDDQKKLAEEMRRKAEQGSMQLQGEVQELILEEMLKSAFPFDVVSEVGKGIRGADCTLTIRNSHGQECGKIIFESKRTKHFDKNWIEKLKADMRSTAADIGVIVTQAMPEQVSTFTQLDGIWICSFTDVLALVHVLRDSVLKIFTAAKTHENKGDKMNMLYAYLTSNEFSEQWKAIREGFQAMNLSIQKEREAMEKLWKMRQKQLEKVLLNAAHIKGSIEGIAGSENIQLDLIDDTDTLLVDE
ncbi:MULTISPECIES: DUF2130 domain-containing protein [Niastella]|uniref:DUF2130 domain-containing protein n=1 Tax=Niastella soli TaxID=2821487 RepID=A0ABS3Z4B1_9BACT|nr:DUF2130 domain-containing protein [Niastella soli]MBO9205004.1 DUF2130 domain-containing protein [Niastella soli]